ncbi:MAG: hypothetical protein HPY73_04100 [Methanomassiliicoccales archaeon]|nr:MAG: hypothetical protein HPY73_04100 [Methanomassiliicoccales archaeon]
MNRFIELEELPHELRIGHGDLPESVFKLFLLFDELLDLLPIVPSPSGTVASFVRQGFKMFLHMG